MCISIYSVLLDYYIRYKEMGNGVEVVGTPRVKRQALSGCE
jgi:hypothetical protein